MIFKKVCFICLSFLLMTTIIMTASIIPLKVGASNTNYQTNDSPLVENPFIPLPVGSVSPGGWLYKQMDLQRDGLLGHAESVYDIYSDDSWYLGGETTDYNMSGWYYARGLTAFGYIMKDSTLTNRAYKWIDWAIGSQTTNGWFGPGEEGQYDGWTDKSTIIDAIRDYYDVTQDSRVVPFVEKFIEWCDNVGFDNASANEWTWQRQGSIVQHIYWLYNITKDSTLLPIADKLRRNALEYMNYEHTAIFNANSFITGDYGNSFLKEHMVQITHGLLAPSVYYQQTILPLDRDAYWIGYTNLMKEHGTPLATATGSEWLAGRSSTFGIELCTIVESILGYSTSQRILGDARIGDNLEKIAFNLLPGALSKDLRQYQYYTLPNQPQSTYADHHFTIDHSDDLLPGPYSGWPCCQGNWHMGWPYYIKNMWAATNDNGLAIMAYGPSSVTAIVATGTTVTFVESTDYPFDDQITLTYTGVQVSFPLKLRIPSWCENPVIKVNGTTQSNIISGEFYTIDRTWSDDDEVTLEFPMSMVIQDQINNSVSIERGPLVYSLQIGENWSKHTDLSYDAIDFSEYEVLPTTDWNYGLILDKDNPENSISVVENSMPDNPFITSLTPITLTMSAKTIPTWVMDIDRELPDEPPMAPTPTGSAVDITLVPFGAQNIRITYFPVISDMTLTRYEAEDASSNGAITHNNTDASGGKYVGAINYNHSYVEFTVNVPVNGTYPVLIGYANACNRTAIGNIYVNDGSPRTAVPQRIMYTETPTWGAFSTLSVNLKLKAGDNTLKFTRNSYYYELDYIDVADDPIGVNKIESGKIYKLLAKHSNKALDVYGAGTSNGDNVDQWAYIQNNTAQQWKITEVGDGYYKLINVNSGKCLDVTGSSINDGGNVHQWTYFGANNQKWKIEDMGGGYFRLIAKHSGKVLEVDGGATTSGATVQQGTDNGGTHQRWKLDLIKSANIISGETYLLTSKCNGKVLDVSGMATTAGVNVQVWSPYVHTGQLWVIDKVETGYYSLTNVNSDMCLTVYNSLTGNSVNVEQNTYTGGDNQKWQITDMVDGYYKIVAKHSGKTLDVVSGYPLSGTNVNQYTDNSWSCQRWSIKEFNMPDKLYFLDNFEDENADEWSTTTSGSWSVVSDGAFMYYQSSSTITTYSYAGDSTWTDYSVEAEVKPLTFGQSYSFQIHGRYTDINNTYNFEYDNGNIKIAKVVSGLSTTLTSKAYTITTGTTYTFKGVLDGSNLSLYIDDVQQLTTTDASFTSGKICLGTSSAAVKFDDVIVTN